MSEKYNEYIREHKENVGKAFEWLEKNIPEIFGSKDEEILADCKYQCVFTHDQSKYEPDEYNAYDEYFYGGNKSYEVVEQFNRAWLLHIHRNPHHWQYWILRNDNPDEGEIILDMPDIYIIEMICDWWSFSWKKGDLWEMFRWYDERSNYIKLSKYTRKKVIDIFEKIQEKLLESDANENKD